MKVPTITDVARRAAVSIATVSRVMHGRSTVNSEIRDRVHRAMADLEFVPDPSAQAMRSQSTKIIACAIRNIDIPQMAAFVDAAQRVIQDAGYILLLANTGDQPSQEVKLLNVLSRRKVDGFLMTKSSESDSMLEAAHKALRVPVVLIDREIAGNADTVVIDHQGGMKAAVDHLVTLGHRRIALLTGQMSVRPARERIVGFRKAMQSHDIPIETCLISAESFHTDDGFRDASLILGNRPTAIIAGGMSLLPGVLRGIALRGLKVGRDISIIAGSDSDLSELSSPSITAIRWDARTWGRISAEMLLRRLSGDRKIPGMQVMLPTELVFRQSCAPVAVDSHGRGKHGSGRRSKQT